MVLTGDKKMKKIKNIVLGFFIFSIFVSSSCGMSINNDDNVIYTSDMSISIDPQESYQTNNGTPTHIRFSNNDSTIPIIIDAEVELSGLNNLKQVTLVSDNENFGKMASEWLLPKYPNASRNSIISYSSGELNTNTYMQFSSDSLGNISFVDVSKDINGKDEDEAHIGGKGFITENTPLGMEISAEEAEKEVVDFISKYTPFDYKAYNIRVVNDKDNKIGYYKISMQAELYNIPICIARGIDGIANLAFYADLSPEGIFLFEGNANLKIDDNKQIENVYSFDDIVNRFSEDMTVLVAEQNSFGPGPGIVISQHTIEVNKIYIGYIPEIAYSDKPYIILTPAWCFDYIDSRIENGQEINASFTIAYSIDSGKWIGRFY